MIRDLIMILEEYDKFFKFEVSLAHFLPIVSFFMIFTLFISLSMNTKTYLI